MKTNLTAIGDKARMAARPVVVRSRDAVQRARLRLTRVEHQSAACNVYHCCVQKTGSQWVRAILSDRRTYQYCGLRPYLYSVYMPRGYDPRNYWEKTFDKPFPIRTLATPFYVHHQAFAMLPKQGTSRAFFVSRDPRDIVVSSYFSTLHSHGVMAGIGESRRVLRGLDEEEGLLQVIQGQRNKGLFDAMRSWWHAMDDPDVLLVKFEDLIDPAQTETLYRDIFRHCDINMPTDVLRELLHDYSFARLSGREAGVEDRQSHYRKGTPGDWQSHFTPRIQRAFDAVAGDLVESFGHVP